MAEPHTPYASLRTLLAGLQGLVAASGVILIGLGIGVSYGEATLTRVMGPASTQHLHLGHLYLSLGCTLLLLALVGWCSAKQASRGGLLFYLVILVIIFVVQITVASVVLTLFPLVRDLALEHNVVTLRKNYRGYKQPDDFSAQWNSVMERLKCCGVNNYTDFPGSSFSVVTGHAYPRGCCKSPGIAVCDGRNVSSSVIHQEGPQQRGLGKTEISSRSALLLVCPLENGCFPKLLKITKTQSYVLSWISLGTAAMQTGSRGGPGWP
ncbi:tetraspanin-16 isoform X2 [Cavia porcellus]|uniref:tetraspanin-16 isoform X2 n=1 Tax=Cavia porcellus TaxID=10141 RepID=UPI002FE08AF9